MAHLRGRVFQPVRPGVTAYRVLTGEEPLITKVAAGEYIEEVVSEACIADLAATYRERLRRENMVRPKDKRYKGTTYENYTKKFKYLQLLGLVELVREEPMLYPPPSEEPLLSIRKDGVPHAKEVTPYIVASVRRVFRITELGRSNPQAFGNPTRAYMEGLMAPAAVPPPEETAFWIPTPPIPVEKVVEELPKEVVVKVKKPPKPPKVEVPMGVPVDLTKDVEEAHAVLSALPRPHKGTANKHLNTLESKGIDVTDARTSLDEYASIVRADYPPGDEGTDEYKEARLEAWNEFLDALLSIDATEVYPPVKLPKELPPIYKWTDILSQSKSLRGYLLRLLDTDEHIDEAEGIYNGLKSMLAQTIDRLYIEHAAADVRKPYVDLLYCLIDAPDFVAVRSSWVLFGEADTPLKVKQALQSINVSVGSILECLPEE